MCFIAKEPQQQSSHSEGPSFPSSQGVNFVIVILTCSFCMGFNSILGIQPDCRVSGVPSIIYIKLNEYSTIISYWGWRRFIPGPGDTPQIKDPTPLGGMGLDQPPTNDPPEPRNPPYEVRTPHIHGVPPTDDTKQLAHNQLRNNKQKRKGALVVSCFVKP